jgi:hypothetical protein
MRTELAVAMLIVAFAVPARAQEAPPLPACAEGRERVDGVCCWPGQTFDATTRQCVGAPHCPEALVEHGETCVAPALAPSLAALTQTSFSEAIPPAYEMPAEHSRTTTAEWPVTHEGSLSRVARQDGEDGGLVAASLIVIDIGWVFGLITAGLGDHGCSTSTPFGGFGSASAPRTSCSSWEFAFIPLGGGIASGMITLNGSREDYGLWGLATGIPSVLFQGIGLIMLAGVLGNNQTHGWGIVPIAQTGATARILPGAAASDLGATLGITF